MPDSKDQLDDRWLTAVVAELKRGPRPPLAVEHKVLHAIDQEALSRRANPRRRVQFARAAGLALLAGGSIAAALLGARILNPPEDNGRSPAGQPVRFALEAPDHDRVAIVGDFNNWDPHANPLEREGRTWAVTLALQPGRYRYTFVVDGHRYLADPVRPPASDDDFGAPTSVVTVVN